MVDPKTHYYGWRQQQNINNLAEIELMIVIDYNIFIQDIFSYSYSDVKSLLID